jgi:hypothetical protein
MAEDQAGELIERVERLQAGLDALAAEQRRMASWQAETLTRARRTQALVARTYEALQGWPQLLAQARVREDYELAFTDPEPLISVAVSTYHSPDTLCERALASARSQTGVRLEIIVVGDHCTDDTAERVAALGDERIRFVNLPAREHDPDDPFERWAVKGSVPRARAVELARGRWIAPLAHDDAWDPDHLVTLLEAAREQRAEVAYSSLRAVDGYAEGHPFLRSIGAWPPHQGNFAWQGALFHGGLRFLRYDRACALASEPNDWNLARRAWEAGVRFHYVARDTATLYVHDPHAQIAAENAARGLPPSAAAYP